MFSNISSALSGTGGEATAKAKKCMSPTLRAGIYSAIDQAKPWLIGKPTSSTAPGGSGSGGSGNGGGNGNGSGAVVCGAGDGVAYQPILARIHEHFPNTKMGLEAVRNPELEVAVIVGGITNMILEMSKWDGMAGAMAMRTWVEALGDAYGKIQSQSQSQSQSQHQHQPQPQSQIRMSSKGDHEEPRKERIGRGITRGINQFTDVGLMTRDFAARIQIISLLKTVNAKIHGAGSDEARQGEALWSSKFI